ncbi:MAG: hypothetical protein D6678_07530 [Zetaproteobacteria bacterium]|nr:MAG: hypothetical protein D6678_07530 [Zetaproteobacteria bacterium]
MIKLGTRGFWQAILLFACLLLPYAGVAAEMGRPIISTLKEGQGALYLQGNYMSSALDLLNYAAKTPGSAHLDHFTRMRLGTRIAVDKNVNLGYEASWIDQLAIRSTEPVRVPTTIFGQKVVAQYIMPITPSTQASVETGYIAHKTRSQSVYRMDVNGVRLSMANGQPLFTASAYDKGWFLAVRGRWAPHRDWSIHAGGELRRYTVASSMRAGHTLINSILQAQAPQQTPWHEYHAWLQTSVDWRITQSCQLALDYGHVHIKRNGYIAAPGKRDLNDADRVDGYLIWSWKHGLAFHVHGRAQTHFLLGELPLLYNTRSNHKFTQPFGFISAGVSWRF